MVAGGLRKSDSVYSRSIVKSSLQFVPVCRSLFWFVLFTPSLKKCRESMGSNLGHGFRGGAGRFRGSQWVTKAGEWALRCFDCMAREKQQAGPVPAARFPRAGIARPLPPESTGRLRSWRRIHWPTESPRQHPGVRAGPLRGRRTSHPIPFAWQWPAARPAPACRRKASGRRPSQP